jgi:phage tail protein X
LNPSLAEHGPVLPAGVSVVLPEVLPQMLAAAPISAWD